MEGMALDECSVMTLPASLHGRYRLAGFQHIFLVCIEQGKSWVERLSLLCRSGLGLCNSRVDPDEGADCEKQSKSDEKNTLVHGY